MESADRCRTRLPQRGRGADRRAVAEQLPGKEMRVGRVADPLLRPVGFAQFRHHHAALGGDRQFRDAWLADHARQQFHAFVEIDRGDARQVELVHRLRRCRLRVRIAAEGHTEALPDALRFAVGDMLRPAEGQMLEQMRVTALVFGFEHRANVHADADRHLPRGYPIVPDRIAHSVGKDAELPRGIAGNVAARIEPVAALRLALCSSDRCAGLRIGGKWHHKQRGSTDEEKRGSKTKRLARGKIGHWPILSPSNLAGH